MIDEKKILAIVPARGGSKGIKKKNIVDFHGKPLIAWSIEAAKGSKYLTQCVVSTEDEEIAAIAKAHGGTVPFIRPRHLSLDDSKSDDVVLHTLENMNGDFDIVVLLQPTSPLRVSSDIDTAIEMFLGSNAKTLVSVSRSSKP